MTSPIPLVERRWYRIMHWAIALYAAVALAYAIGKARGWIPGVSGPLSTLLMIGASTCFIWGLLIGRRSTLLKRLLIGLAAVLFAWSVISLSRGN